MERNSLNKLRNQGQVSFYQEVKKFSYYFENWKDFKDLLFLVSLWILEAYLVFYKVLEDDTMIHDFSRVDIASYGNRI